MTILISVRRRFALQRKVRGIIRLDDLLIIGFVISHIVLMAQALPRVFIESNASGFEGWNMYSWVYSIILVSGNLFFGLAEFCGYVSRTF